MTLGQQFLKLLRYPRIDEIVDEFGSPVVQAR